MQRKTTRMKFQKTDSQEYKYLFLDRDGVINIERPNDYVKNTSEFIFIEGAMEAITRLSSIFENIFIITNQRGIGRGIMTADDLGLVHKYMLAEIEKAGGKINNIYVCTDTSSTSINRKPNVGMAYQAKRDFPKIDFDQSVMIGNSRSDIDFGNKLNMYTVLVGDKYKKDDKIYQIVNAHYNNLLSFALTLQD